MSILVSGLLGVAITVAPNLFKLLSADREDGDFREEAVEIVKRFVQTDDESEAKKKLAADPELEAKLRVELAELEVRALEEQARSEAEQKKIDLAFLELEEAERDQRHQQQLDHLNAKLKRVDAARTFALEASKSEKWWIAGINPFLSLVVTVGFLAALYLIMVETIENVEIFYTAIGALATAFATVVGFHFGSSSGSKEKDEMIITVPSAAEPETATAGRAGVPAPDRDAVPEQTGAQGVPAPKPKPAVPLPDPGGTFGLFRQKAPGVMQNLMDDFGLTLDQAAGVLGNIGHECAGFRTMQEIKPIVAGSKGGWGWCQWTGPRRRAFEAWCQKNGFDNLSDDDANYGFLKHELETTEKNALRHLRKTLSLRDATRSFMDKFERPGIKHFDGRLNWAREALKAKRNSQS